jgi:hypothetical protein
LAKGTPFGLSGLLFLLASYFLILYRRRFDSLHPLFLPVFVFLISSLYSWLIFHHWFWLEILILTSLALGVRYWLVFFLGQINRGQIKLQ